MSGSLKNGAYCNAVAQGPLVINQEQGIYSCIYELMTINVETMLYKGWTEYLLMLT